MRALTKTNRTERMGPTAATARPKIETFPTTQGEFSKSENHCQAVSACLRVSEAAAYLAISERTCWTLVQNGQIPAIRFGKIVRIERSDLDSFIQAAKGGAR